MFHICTNNETRKKQGVSERVQCINKNEVLIKKCDNLDIRSLSFENRLGTIDSRLMDANALSCT